MNSDQQATVQQAYFQKVDEKPIEEIREDFYQLFQEALAIEESEREEIK